MEEAVADLAAGASSAAAPAAAPTSTSSKLSWLTRKAAPASSKPSRLTKAGRAARSLQQCLASADALLTGGVSLTPARAAALDALQQAQAQAALPPLPHLLRLKTANASPALEAWLAAAGLSPGCVVAAVRVPDSSSSSSSSSSSMQAAAAAEAAAGQPGGDVDDDDGSCADALAVLAAFRLPADPAANLLLLDVSGQRRLPRALACVAAYALLGCVPALFVAEAPCAALEAAAQTPAGRLWGVCASFQELGQRLSGDVGRAAALQQALLADVAQLVAPFRNVDMASHFIKRAGVAFVPFGVHAVNAAGLVQLARRVLDACGMGGSGAARRAVAGTAAATGAKVTAIDSCADVYQLVVTGSIVADALSSAAGAAGAAAALTAAADSVSVVDALTLGSVCVITGLVSAWGAAACRPAMVDAMARVVAAQQLAAAARPALVHLCEPDDAAGSGGASLVADGAADDAAKRKLL